MSVTEERKILWKIFNYVKRFVSATTLNGVILSLMISLSKESTLMHVQVEKQVGWHYKNLIH